MLDRLLLMPESFLGSLPVTLPQEFWSPPRGRCGIASVSSGKSGAVGVWGVGGGGCGDGGRVVGVEV